MSKSVPRFVAACCLLASLTLCRPTLASEFDIVINEIHYHPFSGADDDEFVELHNRGTTTVDLSGWRFTEGIRLVLSGWRFTEGIRLVLPAGTSMPPKSYLVVSPDASHTQSRFGIDLVVGSYEGRLADGGEVIAIENRADDVISRVHFGDTHPWSSRPDGLGPSLELTDPHAQIDVPRNWAASRFVDGSPGEENSTLRVIPFRQTAEVVRDHELWRYRTGEDPYPTGWQLLGFDDGAWRSAAMGIGYGDGDDATILEDMRYRYCSIAARKSFELTEDALDDESDLVLEIRYDDGFTGWVNGVEFARANLGEAGNPIAYNERAFETSEADITKRFTIPRDFLRVGENVLAFQVHNESINSTDFSFIPKVVRRVSALPLPDQAAPSPIVINEIRARDAEVPGFVEIYNRGDSTVSAAGYLLVDSLGGEFVVPASTSMPPGTWLSFSSLELGLDVALTSTRYALLDPERSWVDALNPRSGRTGDNGFSYGLYPDGESAGFVLVDPRPVPKLGPFEIDHKSAT